MKPNLNVTIFILIFIIVALIVNRNDAKNSTKNLDDLTASLSLILQEKAKGTHKFTLYDPNPNIIANLRSTGLEISWVKIKNQNFYRIRNLQDADIEWLYEELIEKSDL